MKTLVLDLDGTMYRGPEPIEAGIRLVKKLLAQNRPFLFLTNNSMRTPAQNARHMLEMGYEGILPEHFYNSAMASAAWARRNLGTETAAFIGQEGMREALEQEGIRITDRAPQALFVGLDKTMDYAGYSRALGHLLNGAALIGTNKDRILAKPGGFEVGNGSVVALFEYASGQKSPDIGKPHAPILDFMLEKHGLRREDVILVGDNLETDIALGYNNHVKTILVESGVHNRHDIDRLGMVPDLVIGSLDELTAMIEDGSIDRL